MITITESEAFIYDLLAGLVVKVNNNPDSDALKGRLMALDCEIQGQVGALLHEQVCASQEYIALLLAHDTAGSSETAQATLQSRWFTRR